MILGAPAGPLSELAQSNDKPPMAYGTHSSQLCTRVHTAKLLSKRQRTNEQTLDSADSVRNRNEAELVSSCTRAVSVTHWYLEIQSRKCHENAHII